MYVLNKDHYNGRAEHVDDALSIYKNKRVSQDRDIKLKLSIAGSNKPIEDRYIANVVQLTYDAGTGEYCPGNVFIPVLDVTLSNNLVCSHNTIFQLDIVFSFYQESVGDIRTLTIPFGKYKTLEMKVSENTTSFKAYPIAYEPLCSKFTPDMKFDYSGYANLDFFSDREKYRRNYQYTLRAMVDEIVRKTGIEIVNLESLYANGKGDILLECGTKFAENYGETESGSGEYVLIPGDPSKVETGSNYFDRTCLEQLSLIANLLGKVIVMDRDGKVRFTELTNSCDGPLNKLGGYFGDGIHPNSDNITHEKYTGSDYVVIYNMTSTNRGRIVYNNSKLSCEINGDETLTSVSNVSGDTLAFKNPYMTQQQLDEICEKIYKISYQQYEFSFSLADLLLEPLDYVYIYHKNLVDSRLGYNWKAIPLQYMCWTFTGNTANLKVRSFTKDDQKAVTNNSFVGPLTQKLEGLSNGINTLNTNMMVVNHLIAGNSVLSGDQIITMKLTANNVNIDNGVIKNAMIDNLNADKIQGGTLRLSNGMAISSTDDTTGESLVITDSAMQFKKDNDVRVHIGKLNDEEGNYAFYIKNGSNTIIDDKGIHEGIVIDPNLIGNIQLQDGAVSGEKIDWSSFSKTYNDPDLDIEQRLNAAYITIGSDEASMSLTEQIDYINGDIETNMSNITVNANKIESLVSGDLKTEDGKALYNLTKITQEIDGIHTEVSRVEKDANDKITAANSKIDQTAESIRSEVSNSYATKDELSENVANLNSSITQTANSIKTEVSETYATKTELSNEVTDLNSTITQTAEAIRSEVSAVDTKLDGKVKELNTTITQTAESIRTDASKTYATKTSLSEEVGKLNTAITQTATSIRTEASKTYATKTSLSEEVGKLNSAITQSAESIRTDVSKTYVTNTKLGETVTNLNTTITQTAEAIRSEVKSQSIGGENLIKNSNFEHGLNVEWNSVSQFTIDQDCLLYHQTELTEDKHYQKPCNPIHIPDSVGRRMTLSFDVWPVWDTFTNQSANIAYVRFFDNNTSTSQDESLSYKSVNITPTNAPSGKWTRLEVTVEVPASALYVRVAPYVPRNGKCWWRKFQLQWGEKATEWNACPDDAIIYTEQATATITGEINDLSEIITLNNGSDAITPQMKAKLVAEYNDANEVRKSLHSMHEDLKNSTISALHSSLETKFATLTNLINPIKTSMDTTEENGMLNILNAFNAFYRDAEEMNKQITLALKSTTDSLSTKIEQTSKDITLKIDGFSQEIGAFYTHFKFDNNGLTIRSSQNSSKYIVLDNDSLDFKDGGEMVAQVSDQKLTIGKAEITGSMQIGNLKIRPSGKGGVIFVFE